MKAKVLFISALCVLSVYSCSNDRDEQLTEESANSVVNEKLELKKLKPINKDSGSTNRTESDTVIVSPPAMSTPFLGADPKDPSLDPNPTPDPNEGDDPKNVPPRK